MQSAIKMPKLETEKASAHNTGFNSSSTISTPITGSNNLGPQSATNIYSHIHETASKRIQTLDYLRSAHNGRVYWFNTTHFSKADLARMPYFEKRKLTRRALNFLFLGFSLPPILDVSSGLSEYLKSLNALLLEFESFQQIHSVDGGPAATLARARLPHMFKRSGQSTKVRRTSSATEIGLPMQSGGVDHHSELKPMGNMASAGGTSAVSTFPSNSESQDLLPGEEYTFLLTPSLPFDPDYFEIFATLCDVLIDCYSRLVSLVSHPSLCNAAMGELFTKADAKLRKVIVSGIVREFEDASRASAKSEIAGVGRMVLGGLLG
ncbi:hypothetical protein H106_08931 [Trichophyton rubrum CBS 735.88]|nr:hypothetical protein H106_08931 [Trichophyton rubrum CBS 735.88]